MNMHKIEKGSCRLKDGTQLSYLKSGCGSINIMLLHGLAGSSFIWRRFMLSNTGRFTCWAFDMKGFGDSSKPSHASDYKLSDLVKEMLEAGRTLGIGNAIVIGHSMGGQVAMSMACTGSKAVRALVVVDSGPKPSLKVREWLDELENKKDLKGFMKSKVPTFFNSLTKTEERSMVREAMKMSFSSLDGLLRNILKFDATACMKKLTIPTMLIFGENDNNRSLAELKELNALVKGSRLYVVKGSKHCPMYENEKEFSRRVIGFADFVTKRQARTRHAKVTPSSLKAVKKAIRL